MACHMPNMRSAVLRCLQCLGSLTNRQTCPTCRAPFIASAEEQFKRVWKLVHDRSPGWHTAHVQYFLSSCYLEGRGVKQDDAEAFKWIKRAADNGYGAAMGMAGLYYGGW